MDVRRLLVCLQEVGLHDSLQEVRGHEPVADGFGLPGNVFRNRKKVPSKRRVHVPDVRPKGLLGRPHLLHAVRTTSNRQVPTMEKRKGAVAALELYRLHSKKRASLQLLFDVVVAEWWVKKAYSSSAWMFSAICHI